MKVLLNLTNDTLEYQDTKVFIQGTDARNQIIVYADEDITFTNLTIAYQLQNGRTTIAMANSGLVESDSDDYLEGYTGYIFNVPLSVTTLTGNIMATVVANISGAKHKFNILNTVIDSVFFEAYETALEEAESEFATDIESMQSAITQLQSSKADKTALNAEIARATAKEGELETAIGNEVTRATGKENEIAGDLANEILRATGVEGGLNTRLSTIESQVGYVELTGDSGELTDTQYAEILKPNCVIKLGSFYYQHQYTPVSSPTSISFIKIPNFQDITSGGTITAIKITNDWIRVNTSNKTWTLWNNLDKNVYTTNAIDTKTNDLQSQIDGLNAGQNLADIVTDLTALNNLSITNLHDGDKVQVLVDSNHDNASTVYSLSISGSSHSWTYIGKYGQDGYTKSEANALLETKQDLIDSTHKLSSDLVDDTNATHKFVSASEKAQITANQNAISAIKDGTTIDSFSDVEGALSGKVDKSQIGYIELNSVSGELTDTQYAECIKPYCYIFYDEKLYYKTDDSDYYGYMIFTEYGISDANSINTLFKRRFYIYKSNKYFQHYESLFRSYNKDKTDELLANSVNDCKAYTDKKIEDLAWVLGGNTLDISSDTTTAYQKSVPSGVYNPNGTPKALLNIIGGMSYKRDLVVNTLSNANIDSTGYIVSAPDYNLEVLQVENGKTYYFANEKTQIVVGYFADYPTMSSRTADNVRHVYNNVSSFVAEYTGYACVRFSSIDTNTMIYDGITDSAVTSVASKDSDDITIDTYTIPAEIQALEGYGWGINDTCYNYIDYEAKKYVQKVARVDLGTLNWTTLPTSGTTYRMSANLPTVKNFSTNVIANIICAKYETKTATNLFNRQVGIASTGTGETNYLTVYDENYNTIDSPSAFKTAMSGVYLYYELATPIETNISQYIDNNFIEVEENGTITYNNTYEQAVPSDIDYLVKEVKA